MATVLRLLFACSRGSRCEHLAFCSGQEMPAAAEVPQGLFACWTREPRYNLPSLRCLWPWAQCFIRAVEAELIRWIVSLSPRSALLGGKTPCCPLLQSDCHQSMLISFSKRNKPWLRAAAMGGDKGRRFGSSLNKKREGKLPDHMSLSLGFPCLI